MRRTGLALALACGGLAVASCGEDQQFIDDYNEATRPLQEIAAGVGAARPGSGGAGQEFDRLADQTQKVNADLAKLEAPADARTEFDDLRAALRSSERDLRVLARATREDDIAKLTTATEALERDTRAVDRAENAVKREVED